MPVDALFEKLRLAERRLTAAEERVRGIGGRATNKQGAKCKTFAQLAQLPQLQNNSISLLLSKIVSS